MGLVVAGEGWHPGVIGIVASRLVEKHHRPVVVISLDGEGGGRGSGRSISGFDLLAGLEACSEHLGQFGGHKAAAGLELEAKELDAFREAFAAHANKVLAPEDLKKTERVDAIVGGASLGLDLAEELRQLAPFGMGNPGVRLLVPSARVRDVRKMGEEGKHARFSLHSGAHRALGVAFGRSSLGVGEDDLVDVAVRLEVNRWNGAVEPRVVLRELYPREAEEARLEEEEWWQRFEDELARDPAGEPVSFDGGDSIASQREVLTSGNAPAAVVGELASSGESVLALCADAGLRAGMARDGVRLADYAELERVPELRFGLRPRGPGRSAALPGARRARRAGRTPGAATCTGSGARPSGASRRGCSGSSCAQRDADRHLPRPARRRRGGRRGAAAGTAGQRAAPAQRRDRGALLSRSRRA